MIIIIIIACIIAFIILWLTLAKVVRRLLKFPAPPFIGRLLDSNYRRWQQPPQKVIVRSGIKEGMRVLEIGCGSGAFTTFVARAVGPSGKVFALDIEPKMLAQLKAKLSRPENQDIRNIELVNKSAYELPFPDASLDAVYMVTVFQEIPDRNRALDEIKRVLKPGGLLGITELFPDPDYPWKSTTIRQVTSQGFQVDGSGGNFWNYTVRFRKPQ
jgi:ubiquinone/menaquinone biosynthesis C-methylase UbiE